MLSWKHRCIALFDWLWSEEASGQDRVLAGLTFKIFLKHLICILAGLILY